VAVVELVVLAPEAAAEAVADLLADELDALSVSLEDADAGTADEQAVFGEPGLPAPATAWPRSRLRALFDDEAAATRAAARVLARGDTPAAVVESIAPVDDVDWVRRTQQQFDPVPVTADFWIVPSWHEPPAAARTVIRLDPGLAFGTGSHPTTRMCLRWIAGHVGPGRAAGRPQRVLDYGCGSGILAIAAALHGAQAVDAVDIDPAAVTATQQNAQRHAVAVAAGDATLAGGAYDVVLANILATPLKLLAPLLASRVVPGGHLVLAGLLERQVDELRAAYRPWCDLQVGDQEDGWAMLVARFGTSPPTQVLA
jgi:ribosomal protein L11 methyltransferase